MSSVLAPTTNPQTTTVPVSRLADYLAITRPRISLLVLFTVGAGALYASPPVIPWWVIFHAVLGTALVASGASALNQWLESDSDGRMRRTRNRPLPAGRLSSMEVFLVGMLLALIGTLYLLFTLPTILPALLAAFTFVSYVAVYTPLKRITTLNTVIGAIPGAMPPLIGYAALRGEITYEALALFGIVFVWQIPHFLAIAWMYREEYARAGLRMLPVIDPTGRMTSRQMIAYCLLLIPVALLPLLVGKAGWIYAAGSVLLALYFLRSAIRFARNPEHGPARSALRASLLYLPLVLALLLLDRWCF